MAEGGAGHFHFCRHLTFRATLRGLCTVIDLTL